MSFEKRVCVLKQVKKGFTADGSALSGAVYVERMGNDLTVMPRLLGVAPVREGRYALAIWIEGRVYVADLKDGALRLETGSVKSGLAVLLVYIRGEAEPVAFGSCGAAPTDYAPLLAAFSKSEKKPKRPAVPMPPTELPNFSPNVPRAPGVPLPEPPEPEDHAPFRGKAAGYDDEAIAEQDYFGPAGDGDESASGGGAEREEAQADGTAADRDDGARQPFYRSGGALTYYFSVREKLAEVLRTFEKDERLNNVFPCSEWVKTDDCLLGIVYENGLPKYLCVAVEARRQDEPPEEMREHACFVPQSPVSDMVGFYVVFQSADTGEYVTVGQS